MTKDKLINHEAIKRYVHLEYEMQYQKDISEYIEEEIIKPIIKRAYERSQEIKRNGNKRKTLLVRDF